MGNHVGANTSHRQGYKMASAIPADSSKNLQLSQRNDGPEKATIARDRYIYIANKNTRLLIILDLFAMVFKRTI